jgi:hypothetical protein
MVEGSIGNKHLSGHFSNTSQQNAKALGAQQARMMGQAAQAKRVDNRPTNMDYEDYYLSQKIRAAVHNVHNTINGWEKKIFISIESDNHFDMAKELTVARKALEHAIDELKVLEEKHLLQDV